MRQIFKWFSWLSFDSTKTDCVNPPFVKVGTRPRPNRGRALPARSSKPSSETNCDFCPHVERHLKKAEGKPDDCRMRNIDFIYLINLDQRPEKFLQSKEQLDLYEIYPYRFSAINGWDLSLGVINDVGVKFQSTMEPNYLGTFFLEGEAPARREIMHRVGQTYFCDGFSRGAMGCALSHLSVLQDAYNSGYATIWVMEDDIQIIQNPHRLSAMIDELDVLVGKDSWDVLFTDVDTKNQMGDYIPCKAYAIRPNYVPANPSVFKCNKKISSAFRRIGTRYGAYSMIIRRSGIEKILDFLKAYGIFLPYDMDYVFPPSIHLYTVRQDIVSTMPTALSDNGNPSYNGP